VDDLWATKSEDVELMLEQLISKIFNLSGHNPPTSQTDGQADRQTDIVGFWGDHQVLPVSDRLARFDLVV